MDLYEEMLKLIPDKTRVSENVSVRDQHSRDINYHEPQLPQVVVFPTSKEEVQKVLSFANAHKIPIVPFGAGSSLEGHIIPLKGGISLDLTLMNAIKWVRPDDFLVCVEPGVTRMQLNQRLKRYGLFFPVEPGADATIGGMTATGASGTTTVKYGTMREQVRGLEVVLAAGKSMRTGGMALKSSAGYNLTQLFIGSEGTLGVFTEIILKVRGIPETDIAAKAVFPTIEQAGQGAINLLKAGINIGKVELVDERTIAAMNAHKETDFKVAPTLFLEFSGSEAQVREEVKLAESVLKDEGCEAFAFETDSVRKAKMWEARHQVAFAVEAANPGKGTLSTDVCVPISDLPKAIAKTRRITDEAGLNAAIFGHVGDGNFHSILPINKNDPEDIKRIKEINRKIVHYALELGGTCTGEHGIGMGKKEFLRKEHEDNIEVMEAIKKMLDPKGILNPGKVL